MAAGKTALWQNKEEKWEKYNFCKYALLTTHLS